MKAGAAKVDITPKAGVWMDGMIRSHPSVGVHDPLFARALYLSPDDDPSNAFVVVSADVCGIRAADALRARRLAEQRTGIPAAKIIIAATHTHSGPATVGHFNPPEEAYIADLAEKLALAIEQAVKSARPAAAGCASGREDTISHYRRLLADDGHVVMNWEPYPPEHIVGPLGEVDPEVGVLKVTSADDPSDVICILFNHAGHPNVLSGDNYLISADYPGLAARLIEDEFGGVAMFVNGAQGTMDIDGLRDRDWEGMERVGRALASAVSETARSIIASEWAHLRGSCIRYALPRRKITDQEWAWAQEVLRRTGGKVQAMADGVGDDYKALLYMRLREHQSWNPWSRQPWQSVRVEQICFAVDDTALISFPGELFTEIGMRIKAESPFSRTYILGLANGSIGYIPTRKAVGQGGYEVDTRPVDASAEEAVVNQSLELLNEVHMKT